MAMETRIQVRLTEREREDLVKKAKSLGYSNYADYIRALVWDFDTVVFKMDKLNKKN